MAWTTATFNQNGGSGGETRTLYANYSTWTYEGVTYYEFEYFATRQSTSSTYRVKTVAVPTKAGYEFAGYYSPTDSQFVQPSGNVLDNGYTGTRFSNAIPFQLAARWNLVYTTATLDAGGGSGGTSTFYRRPSDGKCFSDAALTTEISAIVPPTRGGYLFAGATYNGVTVIDSSGNFTAAFAAMEITAASITVVAQWTGDSTTVTVSANGGTGGTSTFYRRMSDGVCFADADFTLEISYISLPTRQGYDFIGATYNGATVIDSAGNFTAAFADMSISAASITVTAEWQLAGSTFGSIVDFFGLASDTLIPIASDNGDNKKRVCVTNASWSYNNPPEQTYAGRYSSGVDSTSNTWRNPSVTYRVVGDMTFVCQLGKAFAKSGSISGYMIAEVEIATLIGEFPVVRVEGVANEGANAINLFNVSVAIEGAAHAQNLAGAIGGDCILQRCTFRAKADPVVLAENNFPCASDVVRGQMTVIADMIAETSSDAPSAANGFAMVGNPKRGRDGLFESYAVTLQKEIT